MQDTEHREWLLEEIERKRLERKLRLEGPLKIQGRTMRYDDEGIPELFAEEEDEDEEDEEEEEETELVFDTDPDVRWTELTDDDEYYE